MMWIKRTYQQNLVWSKIWSWNHSLGVKGATYRRRHALQDIQSSSPQKYMTPFGKLQKEFSFSVSLSISFTFSVNKPFNSFFWSFILILITNGFRNSQIREGFSITQKGNQPKLSFMRNFTQKESLSSVFRLKRLLLLQWISVYQF